MKPIGVSTHKIFSFFLKELLYKHNLRPSLYQIKRSQAACSIQEVCFEERAGTGLACNKISEMWAQEKDLKDLKGHGPVPACSEESTSTDNIGRPRKDRVAGGGRAEAQLSRLDTYETQRPSLQDLERIKWERVQWIYD